MRNFRTVFNFEFKQLFKKKSTIITLLIYFILAFGITFIPSIAAGNSPLKNFFSEEDGSNFKKSGYVVKDISFDKKMVGEAKEYKDKAELEKDIKDDKIKEGVVLTKDNYEYLTKTTLSGQEPEIVTVFNQIRLKQAYTKNGISYDKVMKINSELQPVKWSEVNSSEGSNTFVNVAIVYVFTFVIYFTVIMFGSQAAINVVKEKSNRAMELLIVTVKPRTLILGKVLALSTAALVQMLLIVGGMLLGIKLNFSKYGEAFQKLIKTVDYKVIVVGVVFGLTGFVMFMFLYAAFASLVSRVEEVNSAVGVPMILFIAAFFVNMYVMGNAGSGRLTEILSYVPFTSYFVMFTRYATTNVSYMQLAISYGILLVTTIIIALICVKVYRMATLRYGKKLSFFKMFLG